MTTLRKVTETAADLKDSVQEFSRSAGKKLDEARESTGRALHAAASSVRHSSAAIDNAATGAADRLDVTAKFVRNYRFKNLLADLRKFGRRHPAGTLMVAAAAGFLAGSALSRATRSSGR